jgi:hypothetical protein
MLSQTRSSRKRCTAALFNAYKRFFIHVRAKMSRQSATVGKRLSAAWLNTNKRLFTRMRSKMSR